MQIAGKSFTIGADPEVFMGLNGSFVSAHDKVPGTKWEPHPVENGAVQVDGMALEFNIDPATNYEEFQRNLDGVQGILKGMIGDHSFLDATSVEFSEEFLKEVPMLNREIGCSPDFNGWTLDENPVPQSSNLMRTVGGHVHIGGFEAEDAYHPDHFMKCARLARILDSTLGVYSILWDKDDQRRSMYGRAGSFRPKTYGMEYRTLSNKWIFKPELVKFVYDSVERALALFEDTKYEPSEESRRIIDESDREAELFSCNMYAKMAEKMA